MAKRHRSYYDSYWPSYEPTHPIEVKGGIKARSQQGKFVKNWWADRWIKALTPLMDSARLSRGRSYARQGQVLNIDVTSGQVTSRVQGSRRTPYKVSIDLKPLSPSQWNTVLDALAAQAIYAAQLLNGEMPPDIEQVFETAGVPLFPVSRRDLKTGCSCPDSANPCKHIAAVYYLLGERFDEDPFLLFQLRGYSKEEIAAALRERRAAEAAPVSTPGLFEVAEPVEAPALAECLDRYWTMDSQIQDMEFNIAYPPVSFALLKRLGIPSFRGLNPQSFRRQMERVYDEVTAAAIQAAFADDVATQP